MQQCAEVQIEETIILYYIYFKINQVKARSQNDLNKIIWILKKKFNKMLLLYKD